jgi:hypothetical protein
MTQARRRLVLKRRLRARGVHVPEDAREDFHALLRLAIAELS